MNPAKAWALLGARGAGLEISSPGFNRVTQSDIAAMLAGWPKGPYLMGMVRLAGDELGSAAALERELRLAATEIAHKERWPSGASRVPSLTHLALWELLRGESCRHCNGVGYTIRSGYHPRHCDVCDGKRTRRFTEAERARWSGMSERHWRREWSARYERVYGIAKGWEEAALALMKHELRRNGE